MLENPGASVGLTQLLPQVLRVRLHAPQHRMRSPTLQADVVGLFNDMPVSCVLDLRFLPCLVRRPGILDSPG